MYHAKPFHLMQLKTISHALSGGSRPQLAGVLALRAEKGGDGGEDRGQGHGGVHFYFTAGLHHYRSAELLRVDTADSKSRGKHRGSQQQP